MHEKTLLIVMGSMGRGGAEKVISHISNDFANRGWRVYIALLLRNTVDYKLHEGVHVVDLSGATQSRWKRLPSWLRGIRRLAKEIKPDTVLSFVARINVITQLALRGLKIKTVVSERNDPYSDGRSRFVDLMTNRLYPKADAVVFQTKRSTTYFEKVKLKNAVVIPNPVAVACERAEEKAGKIVTMGRLAPQKNQKMLIEAFAEVHKAHPYAELHIFGEGELREALQAQIAALGLSEHVFLRGNLLDVHKQIADAAIFALPSDYEGLSNALLEAMLMGLPCVSTDCAGSDEYIENGKNGLLVHTGQKDEMAAALCRLLSDREEAQNFGNAARARVLDLQKDVILEKWYDLMK